MGIIREITYETTTPILYDDEIHVNGRENERARALSLNMSSGGMLLLTDRPLELERVLRLRVPTPLSRATTPTLAEVRWSRMLPFGRQNEPGIYLVGVKYLF